MATDEQPIEEKIIEEPARKVERVVADRSKIEPKAGLHEFTDIELVLVVLVAVIIGMIIAALIRKVLDDRYGNRREQIPAPWFYPPPPYMRVHRPEQRREVVPADDNFEERLERKAILERTPGSYLKHGVYLDEDGEAVYDPDFSVYETWQVMRDARGRITDAVRLEE